MFISLFTATIANAQFTDDMESYALGPVFQNNWSNWDNNPASTNLSAIASTNFASSGTQSMLIDNNTIQDAVLNLGNKSTGIWTVEFKLLIPGDSTGYYNFQEVTHINGGAWALNFFFNDASATPGTAIIRDDSNPALDLGTFAYPQSTWFTMTHVINLDTDEITVRVDGNQVYTGAFLSGIDFYSIDANHQLYIDDVSMTSGAVGIKEFDTILNLSVYPNPMINELNISTASNENITNVILYDLTGKVVKNINYNDISVIVNTDDLAAGSYIAKITVGEKTKTIKVLK